VALTTATQVLTKQAHGRQPSAEVTQAVQAASAESGVDFSYLLAKAAVESNYNPKAKAPGSSATGLFQFIESTWMSMIREHGAEHGYGDYAQAIEKGNLSSKMRREILNLRFDAKASAVMAAEYTKENQQYLEAKVGEVEQADLYLAHFLGAGGATKFLKAMQANPDACAAKLFPAAARANKAVFYDHGRPCSLSEIREKFATKLTAFAESIGEVPQSNADRLLDSLYFPGLASASAPTAAPEVGKSIGNWAFLRPTGNGQPLLPTADATGLPSNLSFTVQMALANLDTPGRSDYAHRGTDE
jgi:hypothetical protein